MDPHLAPETPRPASEGTALELASAEPAADRDFGFLIAELASPTAAAPLAVYIGRLAPDSRRAMRGALEAVARRLAGGPWRTGRLGRHARRGAQAPPAESVPWHALRRPHVQVLRAELAEAFAPATANKMLAAVKGVLRECWRAGLMNADDYQAAIDVKPVAGTRLMRGRALEAAELRSLVQACRALPHRSVAMRDAALIGVLFTGGLRRSEAVALELGDYARESGALSVRHAKGNKQRIVYLASGAREALDAWLLERGAAPGALFTPVNKGGRVQLRAMSPQAVRDVLCRRAEDASIAPCSPHDLRRTCASELWDAGVDGATIQRLLGHENINTTARYDRRGNAALRKAVVVLRYPF